MVSDYKFHLFCKRLKKEKWRLSKDLSPAMMLLIFYCCLWMSRLWEPSIGCTELPGRSLSPGSLPCHETPRRPYRHHYRCSCPCKRDDGVPTLPSPRALHICTLPGTASPPQLPPCPVYGLQDAADFCRERNQRHFGEGKDKNSERVWEILPFPSFKRQEKYQRNCFLGKTQRFK